MPSMLWTALFALLALFLFQAGSFPIGAGDIFWQIKSGELFWNLKSFPIVDPFSWTSTGKEWVEHEWLTEVFYYGLHHLGGLLAIRLFFAALWLGGIALLYLSLRRMHRNRFASALLTLVFLALVPRQFVPAPSTVSMFLFLLFILTVAPWKDHHGFRRITGAVLLFWAWSNMHAVSMLGLGYLGLWALVSILQKQEEKRRRLFLFLGCLAISFVNPYGYKIHFYALVGPSISCWVDEWRSLPFSHYVSTFPKLIFTFVSLVWLSECTVRIFRTGWKRWFQSHELFLDLASLLSIAVGLRHGRFLWLAMIPSVWASRKLPSEIPIRKILQPLLAVSVLIAVLNFYGWSPGIGGAMFQEEYYKNHLRSITLPVGAADYLLRHPLKGNLFNHYIWGGYLIYRLHPQYKVFIDGRAVLHGREIMEDELQITNGSPETVKLLDKYRIRTLVVGPNYLTEGDAHLLGWKLMFKDEGSSVYHRQAE